MSAIRFARFIAAIALALATTAANAQPAFCWHVRCSPNSKCVVPPNYNPTVDDPAPTVPYSVWFNKCYLPHCADKPKSRCV